MPRVGVGKVDDLFAGRGISSIHTATNAEAYSLIEGALRPMRRGLLLANVIEFDQTWGHRNDVPGFHRGLLELDRALPRLLAGVREEDLVIFTADHGNDPTTPSTDHSREVVPLLVVGPAGAAGRRWAGAAPSPTSARRWPSSSACRRSRRAPRFCPRSGVTDPLVDGGARRAAARLRPLFPTSASAARSRRRTAACSSAATSRTPPTG